MASIKKKSAPKKKAAIKKAAAPKPAPEKLEALADDEAVEALADAMKEADALPQEEAPLAGPAEEAPFGGPADVSRETLTREDVAQMIADAVQASTREVVAALTQKSPQTVPDAATTQGGKPPANMMTTYTEGEDIKGEDVDLDLLELTDPIGYQMAIEDQQAGHHPGGRRVVTADLDMDIDGQQILTAEQVESMSQEEIDAWNRRELARIQARKRQQAMNRAQLERMKPADRIRALQNRDPNVIREADNVLNERMIKCQSVRRVGLGEQGTSDVGETIMLPLSGARKLQEAGAVRVLI